MNVSWQGLNIIILCFIIQKHYLSVVFGIVSSDSFFDKGVWLGVGPGDLYVGPPGFHPLGGRRKGGSNSVSVSVFIFIYFCAF